MEVIADMYYIRASFFRGPSDIFLSCALCPVPCALVAPKPLAASDLQCLDIFDKTENTNTLRDTEILRHK